MSGEKFGRLSTFVPLSSMGGHGFGGGGKWFRNEGKEIWFGVVVFDKTRKGKRNGESRSTRFSECAPLMSGCCTWNGQFHESVEMISSQHEIKNKIYYLANFIHFYSTFFPLHEYRPKMDIDDLLYDSLMYIYIYFFQREISINQNYDDVTTKLGVLELSEIEEFDRIGCL